MKTAQLIHVLGLTTAPSIKRQCELETENLEVSSYGFLQLCSELGPRSATEASAAPGHALRRVALPVGIDNVYFFRGVPKVTLVAV